MVTLRKGAVVAAAVLTSLGASSLASAAPMEPSEGAWEPFAEVEATGGWHTGPGRVADTFLDENLFFGSHVEVPAGEAAARNPVAARRLPVPPNVCESIAAEPCASSNRVQAVFVLPLCTPERSQDCVDGMYARTESGIVEATFSKEWIGQDANEVPPIQTTRGPTMASGHLPLFRLDAAPHPGGTLYAASVSIDVAMSRQGTTWNPTTWHLGAQIMPVSEIPVGDSRSCKVRGTRAADDTSCLDTDHILPDQVMGIRVKVSSSFGSWIFGRVVEPKITITKSGGSVLLDVEGRPSVTPMLTAVVPSAQVTPDMYPGIPPTEGASVTHFTAGQEGSLSRWSAWNAASGSQADTLKRLWVFRSSDSAFAGAATCIKDGEVAGWVSTNAMVYEATPPTLNVQTGALDFKIGGPALQPDSMLPVSADYELYLRDNVAACIWPGQKVAQVATVSVLDGAGGENITTTSVGQQGGWTKFIARNVLFLNPTAPRARAAAVNPTVRVVVPKATQFANCTLMRKTYKDGVSATGAVNIVTLKGKKVTKPALGKPFVSDVIYNAHAKLDADKDSLVCEREPKVR